MAIFISIITILLMTVISFISLTEQLASSQLKENMEERVGDKSTDVESTSVDLDDFLSSFIDPCLLYDKPENEVCDVCPSYKERMYGYIDDKTEWYIQLKGWGRCISSAYGPNVNLWNIRYHCTCACDDWCNLGGIVWFEAWANVIDVLDYKRAVACKSAMGLYHISPSVLNDYRQDNNEYVPNDELYKSIAKYWVPLMGRKTTHKVLPPIMIPTYEQSYSL